MFTRICKTQSRNDMKHLRMSFLAMAILLQSALMSATLQAQDEEKKDSTDQDEYQFVIDKELPATPIKNQYRTGTCWSFSTISFLESELLRMGKVASQPRQIGA